MAWDESKPYSDRDPNQGIHPLVWAILVGIVVFILWRSMSFDSSKQKLANRELMEGVKPFEPIEDTTIVTKITKPVVPVHIPHASLDIIMAQVKEVGSRLTEKNADCELTRASSSMAIAMLHSACMEITQIERECGYFEDPLQADTLRSAVGKVHAKAVKLMAKYFPKYREAFIKSASDILWEDDISVHGSGNIIYFTSSAFYKHQQVIKAYDQLRSVLNDYRFYQVTFREYSGAAGKTYVINSRPDTAINFTLGSSFKPGN